MDASVAVQADQSEEETEFLLALAEKHAFIAGVVGWWTCARPIFPGGSNITRVSTNCGIPAHRAVGAGRCLHNPGATCWRGSGACGSSASRTIS